MMDSSEYMTIKQAAAYMGISRQQMYKWGKVAGLKKYRNLFPKAEGKKGGCIYFSRHEIDEKRNQFVEVQ